MDVGTKLRKLREDNDMTLEEVSSILGIAKQTLYKYEMGIITNIPLNRIEELASVYHVNPAYITGWEDTPDHGYINDIDDDRIVVLARNAKELTDDQIELIESMIDQLNKQNGG